MTLNKLECQTTRKYAINTSHAYYMAIITF